MQHNYTLILKENENDVGPEQSKVMTQFDIKSMGSLNYIWSITFVKCRTLNMLYMVMVFINSPAQYQVLDTMEI